MALTDRLSDRLSAAAGARDHVLRRMRRRFGIKRYLPRTLFGRSLLIIVTPLLLMQLIAVTYFYRQHWEHMTSRLAFAVAGDIAMLIEELDLTEGREEQRDLFDRAGRTMQLTVTFEPGLTLSRRPPSPGHWILQSELTWALNERVGRAFTIVPEIMDRWAEIQVQLEDGVLVVLVPRWRLFSQTSQVFIIWMVGSAVVLFAVALIFMRNQIRPIRRLAIAADSFGKGRDSPDFKPEGAAEVRRAARAFLVMRDRIQRQIAQRTEMLAGVSHDLRTPLTRMKLTLAMLPDGPDVEELRGDVADMETMIEGYLAFARGESSEQPVPTDLTPLLEELVAGARREGATISLDAEPGLFVALRPSAFKRCVGNLLSNARRHGTAVRVQAFWSGEMVEVVVDDDGPGIPGAQRQAVFRPFYRLDQSRTPDKGGSGLGLTIARDIARNHGGDLVLARSPQNGLRCVVRLPA